MFMIESNYCIFFFKVSSTINVVVADWKFFSFKRPCLSFEINTAPQLFDKTKQISRDQAYEMLFLIFIISKQLIIL